MQVILNIGLESKTLGKIAPVTALSAARLQWLTILNSAVVLSDTEYTLVLEVNHFADVHGRVEALAADLGQDCIAVYYPGLRKGDLVDPRAAEWGPFNPEFFFFLLDGTRLAAPAAKAA